MFIAKGPATYSLAADSQVADLQSSSLKRQLEAIGAWHGDLRSVASRDASWERDQSLLGPPVVPFYPFLGEGSPTEIDYRKKRYPYSILSTGGPSLGSFPHSLLSTSVQRDEAPFPFRKCSKYSMATFVLTRSQHQ